MPKEIPSPNLVSKLLRYDPETGKLFWRDRTPDMFSDGLHTKERICLAWNSRFSGKEAFVSVDGSGYRQGSIFGYGYKAHRVIWAIVNGEWPSEHIDHINGVRHDNRLFNIRDVSCGENRKNCAIRSDNKSGIVGVYWNSSREKWHAKIKVNGKSVHLGYFVEVSEAAIARKKAERLYGFHENHGRSP